MSKGSHLAFDHDNFWGFVSRHWGVSNVSPQKIEELVDVYSERRRIYSQSTNAQRNHRKLLADLIDSWISRDPNPSPPSRLSRQEIAAEWEFIETSWLEQLRSDAQSLLDESDPPHIGTFSVSKVTPSICNINGGTNQPSVSGKGLVERVTEPSADHSRRCSVTSNTRKADSPPLKGIEEAIDGVIQTEGRKRKFTSGTTNFAKRQRVLGSPPYPPGWNRNLLRSFKRLPRKGEKIRNPRDTRVNQHDLEENDTQQNPTLNEKTALCIGQQVTDKSEVFDSFGKRIEEQDENLNVLKERINLLLESGELSRDIRKAHDQLTMLTASKCQVALERLEEISIQLSALGKDVVACRESGEELQKRQTEQQGVILGFKRNIESADSGLKDAMEDSLAHRKQQTHCKESRQGAEARLSQLRSNLESKTGTGLQTKEGIATQLRPSETHLEKQSDATVLMLKDLDERLMKIETSASGHQPEVEFEGRLKKLEETISISKTLVNNCRTLVEANKTSVDQYLVILDNRVNMLEHRFDSHAADQVKINDEQARRLGLVEGELGWYKGAASSQLQSKPGRSSGSELAVFQAQLNAVQDFLAVVAQNQRFNPTERGPETSLSPTKQIVLSRPTRIRQNARSANLLNPVTKEATVKKEN
ncbi:hypothetical protein Ct61P_15036 [Colletotrichum tofieldiae]|nr:hypothetical protein Ct61P_15036 [Colletotrichum tofieldiae]